MSETIQTENVKFIESQDIRVFPYAQDRASDPFGKHLNEQNLTNLAKHFCTFDSFFIGCKDVTSLRRQEPTDSNVYKFCEFMLAGHYVSAVVTLPTTSGEDSQAARDFWLRNNVYAEITHYNASQKYNAAIIPSDQIDTAMALDVSYLQVLGRDVTDLNNVSTFQAIRFVAVSPDADTRAVRAVRSEKTNIDPKLSVTTRVTSLRLFEGQDISESEDWTTYDMEAHVPEDAWIRFEQRTYSQLKWKSY